MKTIDTRIKHRVLTVMGEEGHVVVDYIQGVIDEANEYYSGPGEEDGKWAEGFNERCGIADKQQPAN